MFEKEIDDKVQDYNSKCDEAFGKALRGEISMREYKVEKRKINSQFSTLFAER